MIWSTTKKENITTATKQKEGLKEPQKL